MHGDGMTTKEHYLLRELAKRYAEVAHKDANAERKNRMAKTNDLSAGLRPSLLIDEIPWHEMNFDGSLTIVSQNEFSRQMEWYFRSSLFVWEKLKSDIVIENYYPIPKSFTTNQMGITVDQKSISTDKNNSITSHLYKDVLSTYEELEKISTVDVVTCPETDKKNVEMASEILQGILPVKLTGTNVRYTPWDEISELRGVENILYDLIDRPEFMHAIIKKFTNVQMDYMTRLEELDLLEIAPSTIHCTPAYTNQLPQKDFSEKVRLKDVWFRGAAQIFTVVSQSMLDEFDIAYMRPVMERCGLVYYGCCEALDNKIELLKTIPNMRKIGVSPWSNVEKCAEQIGGDFVFSRKPNPAQLAIDFDEQTIAHDIEDTIKACIRYGCPYEFVLKDISTTSHKPYNLIKWSNTVFDVINQFYG